MNKKYIVRLTNEERALCEATIKKEKGKSEKLRRATIFLKADADGPAGGDAKISEAGGWRARAGENGRGAFVCEGFEGALVRKKPATSPTPKLLDGVAEAKLIAMRWANRPPASAIGRCGCWPINWSNWRSSNRSARRRSVRR